MSIYFAILLASPAAFGFGPGAVPFRHRCRSSVCTSRMTPPKLSELPQGISPYEKSDVDVPAILRNAAKKAIDAAIADDVLRLEIEFPALSEFFVHYLDGGEADRAHIHLTYFFFSLQSARNQTLTISTMFRSWRRIRTGRCNLPLPSKEIRRGRG